MDGETKTSKITHQQSSRVENNPPTEYAPVFGAIRPKYGQKRLVYDEMDFHFSMLNGGIILSSFSEVYNFNFRVILKTCRV